MAVGFPTKVSYANGDVYSSSDVNDSNGTLNLLNPTAKGSIVSASAANTPSRLAVGTDGQVLVADSTQTTGLAWSTPSAGAPVVAGKNGIINGAFQIWQRGTSSAGNAYLADRFYSALISGTGTFAQESTVVPSGSVYSQKFTASATAQPALYQAIETQNAIRFANQTVTVSAKVAASTSVGFTADVQYSTGTDTGVTGSWTSITATSGGTATATSTTFVAISGVYAVPSTAKSLRVRLFTTSTIANTVVVYFGQIQLEQGSTATQFSNSMGTIAGELLACQRYFYRQQGQTGAVQLGMAMARGATTTYAMWYFPVPLRTASATLTATNIGSSAAFKSSMGANDYTADTIGSFGTGSETKWMLTITGTSMTAGWAGWLGIDAGKTTSYIEVSAEL